MTDFFEEQRQKFLNDKEYRERIQRRDAEIARLGQIYAKDEAGLVSELAAIGFDVESAWDFVNRPNDYWDAIPVLKKHLSIEHHPRVMAGIVRSLAIKRLAKDEELWDRLSEMYGATKRDDQIDVPSERGLQQAIAVALELLATKDRIESLATIIQENPKADMVDWLQQRLEKLKKSKKKD